MIFWTVLNPHHTPNPSSASRKTMSATTWSKRKRVCTVDDKMSVWLTKVIWRSESADLHKLLLPWPPLKHRCCPLTAQETSWTTYPRNQQLFSENPDPRNKWTVNRGLHIPVSPENIPCSCYVDGRIHDSEEAAFSCCRLKCAHFYTIYDNYYYLNYLGR